MPDVLYDVNLQALPLDYIYGRWNINVNFPGASPDPAWLLAPAVAFTAATWQLLTPDSLAGTWLLERDARLRQPYLRLLSAQGTVAVLVTRFRRSHSGEYRRLVLYFQSGMELELTCP